MLDITPTQGFPHMYDFIGKTAAKGANPLVLVILTAVIMLYYLLFSYLGSRRRWFRSRFNICTRICWNDIY